MAESNYKNKYFSVLGDSISTLAGYNPPECGVFYDWRMKRLAGILTPEDTWWGYVIEALGGKLLVNHAWSGSTVCRLPGCEVESYGCSDFRTGALGAEGRTPDVVMVFMGLNDLGYGISPASFADAYGLMLKKLKNNYFQAEIWCLTLPQVPDVGGRVAAYNDTIRTCAAENGCRYIDVYRPDVVCDTLDGLHPTARGMRTIADLMLEELGRGDAE